MKIPCNPLWINATPLRRLQPVAPTRLEPGCIGIKIRVLSHRPTRMKPSVHAGFRILAVTSICKANQSRTSILLSENRIEFCI